MNDGLYGSLHVDRIGLFSHLSMSISLAESMLDEAALDRIGDLRDSDENARRVLAELSVIHEMRHLHDCFSTPAGIGLFRLEIGLLRGFCELAAGLAKRKIRWQLPLFKWVKDLSCPTQVRVFHDWYSKLSVLRRAFVGRGMIGRDTGRMDEPWTLKPNGDDREVWAVPVNYVLEVNDEKEYFHEWYPLGFEALIEGAAHAVEKSLVENLVSARLRNRINRRLSEIETRSAQGPVGVTLPYNVSDYAVTRIMSGCYDREILTRLTDFALMDSAIEHQLEGTVGAIAERSSGGAFRDAVERSRLRKGKSGSAVVDPGFTGAAQRALKYCEGVPAFDDCCDDVTTDPVAYIESFATSRLMRPLLKYRQCVGNSVFADPRKYLESFPQLPLAPLIVEKGGHRFGGMTDVFLQKWSAFLMLVSISKQVTAGAAVLHCPRAKEVFPGLAGLDLCTDKGGCNAHLTDHTCSPWVQDDPVGLPSCGFNAWLRRVGLDR